MYNKLLYNGGITKKDVVHHGISKFKNKCLILFNFRLHIHQFIHSNWGIVKNQMLDNIDRVIDFKDLIF